MTRWPAGRVRPADAALAAAVGLLACAGMWQTSAWQLPPARHADAVGYILASGGAVALVLHRRRPLHVLAIATAAAAGSLALRYPYGPPFLAMGMAVYFVAARLPWQRSAVVCAVAYLAAYRIVQQSLANVLRHASSTAATVLIDYTADGVRLEVTDDRNEPADACADPAAAARMRERAAAVGGVLASGPRDGGGFQVRVSLPLHAHGSHRGPRP
jgi:signal transduction histidine kinase